MTWVTLPEATENPGLSHEFGNIDDCVRCIHCETLPSNAASTCKARAPMPVWRECWACSTGKCRGGCIDGFVPREAS